MVISWPGSAVAAPAPGLIASSCRQEEYYWRNPKAYPQHPPTLLVQPVTDCNADTDAARFYHEAMLRHGGNSAYGSRTRALLFRSRGWERGRYQRLTPPRPPAPI